MSVYLIDTSAVVRLWQDDQLRTEWADPIESGTIAMCPVTEIELRFSARSVEDDRKLQQAIEQMFVWAPFDDRAVNRALEVQHGLLQRGKQRSAGAVDLMVAAAAERLNLILLHCDKDFDCIAEVTGQLVQRIDRNQKPESA
jgi:hypothetical protein